MYQVTDFSVDYAKQMLPQTGSIDSDLILFEHVNYRNL